jgi:hypothetical protein
MRLETNKPIPNSSALTTLRASGWTSIHPPSLRTQDLSACIAANANTALMGTQGCHIPPVRGVAQVARRPACLLSTSTPDVPFYAAPDP